VLIVAIVFFALTLGFGVFQLIQSHRAASEETVFLSLWLDKLDKMTKEEKPWPSLLFPQLSGSHDASTLHLNRRQLLAQIRERRKTTLLWVRIALTAVVAPFLAYVILKSTDTAAKDFAFTTGGTILGYWLSANSK
jgi:hypothetical protein